MKNWWKILAALLVLYSLVAGLLVPLKPGILEVQPANARAGQAISLKVTGYNTNFTDGEKNLRAWLKLNDELALKADEIRAFSPTELQVNFQLPQFLPTTAKVADFTMVLDSQVDGFSVNPSALFVTQNEIDSAKAVANWPNASIDQVHPTAGMHFPFRNILNETIRNTYYHVSLWFAMVVLFMISVWYSIQYLRGFDQQFDVKAQAYTQVGVLFGILGCVTGSLWAKATWGTYWTLSEIKLNMAAIALLIYLAYFILRGSFEAMERKARISAVYNIFAFAALIPLIFVIPRITEGSLHPGNGGNPGLGGEDLDNTMRMVFYPAIIGWILMGIWISHLVARAEKLKLTLLDRA